MRKLLILCILLALTACTVKDNPAKQEKENGVPKTQKPIGMEQNQSSMEEEEQIINPDGHTIPERIQLPQGFERIEIEEGSFAHYLRNLPLKPHGEKVYYYDGAVKPKDVHEAVVDMDVGDRDLQQCADAVIRLRAEYLYGREEYDKIHFNFTNGFRTDYSKWMEGYRITVNGNDAKWVKSTGYSKEYDVFREYLDIVYAYAGTISLEQELKPVALEEMEIGDIFIQAEPGHCVIVMDMAENKETGEKLFMLAQSYMPAQDIHILKNPGNVDLSPWYVLKEEETLVTPEWSFTKDELKRFEDQ